MPFKAVSDPTRREILELLAERPHSVREIAELFPVSRPAISKHLRLLREAGLAVERREGRRRFYSLQSEPLREVGDWTRSVVEKAATRQGAKRSADALEPAKAARRAAPGDRARRSERDEATEVERRASSRRRGAPSRDEADDWHVW